MSSTKILTTRGELDESLLIKRTGSHDDENEAVQWQEWRVRDDESGEIVKRDVQMQLKKMPVFSTAEAASF